MSFSLKTSDALFAVCPLAMSEWKIWGYLACCVCIYCIVHFMIYWTSARSLKRTVIAYCLFWPRNVSMCLFLISEVGFLVPILSEYMTCHLLCVRIVMRCCCSCFNYSMCQEVHVIVCDEFPIDGFKALNNPLRALICITPIVASLWGGFQDIAADFCGHDFGSIVACAANRTRSDNCEVFDVLLCPFCCPSELCIRRCALLKVMIGLFIGCTALMLSVSLC